MSNYKLIKKLSEGGQKEVYIIDHPDFGKCALKIGKCSSAVSLNRISREVEILRSINSKYFPKNFFAQLYDNGEFKLIEEYIDAPTLREKKADYFNAEKKVIKLLIELITGLKIIWDEKIVHRDLKPENILIKGNGEPVIIDLGIARVLNEKSLTLTVFAQGPCTEIYASPEQLKNKKNNIDMRSDFFSLAIVASELILGIHPFSPQVVGGISIHDNILNGKYCLNYNNIHISEDLGKILSKCLNQEPYQRIRTHQKLQEALLSILDK